MFPQPSPKGKGLKRPNDPFQNVQQAYSRLYTIEQVSTMASDKMKEKIKSVKEDLANVGLQSLISNSNVPTDSKPTDPESRPEAQFGYCTINHKELTSYHKTQSAVEIREHIVQDLSQFGQLQLDLLDIHNYRLGASVICFTNPSDCEMAVGELRGKYPSIAQCKYIDIICNFQVCIKNTKEGADLLVSKFVKDVTGRSPISWKSLDDAGHILVTVATEQEYNKLKAAKTPDSMGGNITASMNPFVKEGTTTFMITGGKMISRDRKVRTINERKKFVIFHELNEFSSLLAWVPNHLVRELQDCDFQIDGQKINITQFKK